MWLLLGAQLESAVRKVRQRQTQTSAVLAVIVVVAAARAATALLCYCGCCGLLLLLLLLLSLSTSHTTTRVDNSFHFGPLRMLFAYVVLAIVRPPTVRDRAWKPG